MLSTANFGRVCSVEVGKTLGSTGAASGIRLTKHRIVFTVDQSLCGPPNTASILLYNIGPTKSAQIKNEYDQVRVTAGYKGKPGLIFSGNVKFTTTYREGVDWITEIAAADGDRAYLHSHVSVPLAAGRSAVDALDEVLKSMPGVRKGFIQLAGTTYLRGKILSGPAHKILDQIARDNAAAWSITNGTLNIVRADGVLPSQAVVVNANTGMIGAPEVSGKGIKVRMELNPLVEPNVRLVLDNNNIKIQATQLYASGPKMKEKKLVRLDPDGNYKVFKQRHQGDTHGPDWYTDAETVGIGQPIPRAGGAR